MPGRGTGRSLPCTMIDMIGFGIVIPFLTYLVEDLAADQNITSTGIWVGLLMTSYSAAQFLFLQFGVD